MQSDRADKDEILFEERDKYSNLGMDEIIEISSMSSAYMFNFVIWDNSDILEFLEKINSFVNIFLEFYY